MSDITHDEFVRRHQAQKAAKREVGKAMKSLDAGLSKLFRGTLEARLPELLAHAAEGRGFVVHIEVVNKDGSPLDPLYPKQVSGEPERKLILLSDG